MPSNCLCKIILRVPKTRRKKNFLEFQIRLILGASILDKHSYIQHHEWCKFSIKHVFFISSIYQPPIKIPLNKLDEKSSVEKNIVRKWKTYSICCLIFVGKYRWKKSLKKYKLKFEKNWIFSRVGHQKKFWGIFHIWVFIHQITYFPKINRVKNLIWLFNFKKSCSKKTS